MSPKSIIILAVVGLLLIAVVGLGVWYWKSGDNATGEGEVVSPQIPAQTKTTVRENIVVPETSSTVPIPANFAKPSTVVAAAPNAEARFRIFSLSIEKDKITPDTLAVYLGDTVSANITSLDKSYKLIQPDYGFEWNLSKGANKFMFDATNEGKFSFFCESCVSSQNSPVAYLVVVKK